VARLYFGARDLAVSLNGDEQHDLAADVHAASQLRVGGGDAGDDGSLGGCGQDGACGENKAGKEKRTRGTKWECQGNLHTEVVSARGERALAGGEDGRGDFGEGEVFGRAAGALFPIQKELAVAVGEAGGGIYVEFGQSAVDPAGGAFEFDVVADGGFVDEEVPGGVRVGTDGVRPLGAVFFVDEDGQIANLPEDFGERFAFGDDGFGFDADLVARSVDGGLLVGQALVGDGAEAAVLADAEDFAARAEVAGARVWSACGSATGNFSSISADCMGGVYDWEVNLQR
jgi:hypothetical protein